MSDAEPRVLRQLEDGVLLLTLNRPRKKNAFDDPQWDALRDALREAGADDEVSVVVVTGAGGDFSAGVDLASFGGGAPREDGKPNGYYGLMEALVAFDKPLLAAARGVGVGSARPSCSTATSSTWARACGSGCPSWPSASCPRAPAATCSRP